LVDASVWVAATDPDDRFHEPSWELVRDVRVSTAVLDLTLYEVANAVGLRHKRPDDARHLSRLIVRRCRERLVAVEPELTEAAVGVAEEHDLTAYDAAYVAAARRHGWILVSADIRDLVSKGLAVTPDKALYP
jgi:predicted nucleic acid-binding protein